MPKGPVHSAMEARLAAAFPGAVIAVVNDSGQHQGHGGDDGSGESHFTVRVESAIFAGTGRLERQRMVNRALGDLPGRVVHAVAIRARAPGEQP